MRSLRGPLAFIFIFLTAACGDDGNGGSDDVRLSSLSPTEARELCEQILADISTSEWEGVARLGCTFAEVLQEECSNARIDACVSQTVAAIKADPAQCDEVSDSETELEACNVTVSELGDCLDDLIEAIAAVGDALTCENFGNADLDPEIPESCRKIQTACPGLIDTETT